MIEMMTSHFADKSAGNTTHLFWMSFPVRCQEPGLEHNHRILTLVGFDIHCKIELKVGLHLEMLHVNTRIRFKKEIDVMRSYHTQ